MAGGAALSALPLRFPRAQGRIKVGVMLPISGALAAAGQAGQRGIELASRLLAQSGAPPMEILFADTESRPENGRVAAERLIRDGAVVLIGAIDSGATISASQVTEAAKVPLVVNVGAAPKITERGYTQIFRNFMPSGALIQQAVDRIRQLPQDVELFSGTAAGNIARMGEVDSERVVRAAQRANAHELILRLSVGCETPVGEGARRSPVASVSASVWRGRCTATRRWWCSKSPTPVSTGKGRWRFRPPWPA